MEDDAETESRSTLYFIDYISYFPIHRMEIQS